MRFIALPLAIAALGFVAACSGPAEGAKHDQADAVQASGEQKADALENQAAATSNEAQETALNKQADAVEQKADNQADAMRDQIDKEH
jgi:hypothetical protein